jgi:hypothetical protein
VAVAVANNITLVVLVVLAAVLTIQIQVVPLYLMARKAAPGVRDTIPIIANTLAVAVVEAKAVMVAMRLPLTEVILLGVVMVDLVLLRFSLMELPRWRVGMGFLVEDRVVDTVEMAAIMHCMELDHGTVAQITM